MICNYLNPFGKDLAKNVAKETIFHATQGQWEGYIQRKFAYFLSKMKPRPDSIAIETWNRKDMMTRAQNFVHFVEWKGITVNVANAKNRRDLAVSHFDNFQKLYKAYLDFPHNKPKSNPGNLTDEYYSIVCLVEWDSRMDPRPKDQSYDLKARKEYFLDRHGQFASSKASYWQYNIKMTNPIISNGFQLNSIPVKFRKKEIRIAFHCLRVSFNQPIGILFENYDLNNNLYSKKVEVSVKLDVQNMNDQNAQSEKLKEKFEKFNSLLHTYP